MARWLHFDLLGGASGDMCLGALIDLGVPVATLRQALQSLSVEPVHLQAEPAADHGLNGTRVTVHTHETRANPAGAAEPHHDHTDASHHHAHAPHRGLAEINTIIQAAPLPDAVKSTSLAVFERIGRAEAKVHNCPLKSIHFHEVGALDSIADIVGSCLALHTLGVDTVSVGMFPAGHGVIACAHGTYPNPAPATLEILTGLPLVTVDEPHELVTPTGAALLAEWRQHAHPPPGSRIVRVGYGLGQRSLQHRPNILRAVLYETADATAATPDQCLVLECNLDDTTPELVGALTERLRAAGALDVFTAAVQMKQQRPGILLTVLCQPTDRDPMLQLIFTESTTFGVREAMMNRHILERHMEEVATPYGPVRVKVGRWQGDEVTRTPEFSDCQQRAAAAQVPVRHVWAAALNSL